MRFAPGAVLHVREILHGQVWLEVPEQVISDDGHVLASLQVDGSPMTHHAEHPFGAHPWSFTDAWRGPTVLKLRRDGDWYSVWKFFSPDGGFTGWYVNFETPVVRRADGVDVNDLQLDIVVEPDGIWRWKDVEHLAPCLASGRIDAAELHAVLESATGVADLLDRDDRWWAPWDVWTPSRGYW